MLTVKSSEETLEICRKEFGDIRTPCETVPLESASGRAVFEDIAADQYIPGFNRTTVDGLAVIAADTFGSSDTIPAQLIFKGDIPMGIKSSICIASGECASISTGGELPQGADAAVMVENTEDFGDGFRYILKPVAPGENIVRKGDDVCPGKPVIKQSVRINAKDIGALAALGITDVPVYKKPVVAIISTGDEIIPADKTPEGAQMRDVNSHMIAAAVKNCGGEPLTAGIVMDDEEALSAAVTDFLPQCDILIISGGSSAGERDITAKIINRLGKVLLHGIAVKPGKPTVIGNISGKPVFGLPGHPVSAWFVFQLFVRPLICSMNATEPVQHTRPGILGINLPSNHGREEYVPVKIQKDGLTVLPVPIKSGLITLLTQADGFVKIERNREGLAKNEEVTVYLF